MLICHTFNEVTVTSICFYASSFCLICAIKIWNVPETIISLLFQVEFQGQQEFQVQQEAHRLD